LVPAGGGRTRLHVDQALMLIRMNPKSVRTRPLAPGVAANELSTYVPFFIEIPFSSSKEMVGVTPDVGLLGGGVLVVQKIGWRLIGFEKDPT
jgi:hypothetical protein